MQVILSTPFVLQRAALVARLSQANATESCQVGLKRTVNFAGCRQVLAVSCNHCHLMQDQIWPMVQQSLKHARFSESYNFCSFQQGWIRTSRYKCAHKLLHALVALFCHFACRPLYAVLRMTCYSLRSPLHVPFAGQCNSQDMAVYADSIL